MDLESLTIFKLDRGNHKGGPQTGLCLMEAVAWMEGEPHSDRPECACPVIGRFAMRINDAMPDDWRQKLVPFIPRLVGSRSPAHERERAKFLAWQAIRVFAPIWLDDAGLSQWAARMRGYTGDLAGAQILARQARSAASASSSASSAAFASAAFAASAVGASADASAAAASSSAYAFAAFAASAVGASADASAAAAAAAYASAAFAAFAASAVGASASSSAYASAAAAYTRKRLAHLIWPAAINALDGALKIGPSGKPVAQWEERVGAYRNLIAA